MTYNPCENTKTTYRGNGSQRDFSFAFTYTDEPDVIVMMYEDLKQTWVEQTNKYVFAGPTIIRFITAPPRPTNTEGYNIIITRRTNVSAMEATFYPGSSIRAQDLNDNFEQLRASAEDGRCELSSSIDDLKYDVWSKKSISKRSNYTEEQPPYDTTYREDQEKGYWPKEGDTKSIPTTGAVSARLDPYVQDQLPARPPEDGSESAGKLWINTREYWDSYWDPDAAAWVTFTNTGPRGKDGLNGEKGEIGETAYINIAGRIGPGAWEDIKPNEDIKGELYLVDAPITGFPGGGVPKDNEAIGWNGTQWYNYGYTGAEGEKGDTGTIDVNSTTTGSPGTNANVVNVGTSQTALLDFTIPRGDKGEKGDTGEDSEVPGPQGEKGDKGDKGDEGDKGETGDRGPEGPEGPQGIEGPEGPQGIEGPVGPEGPDGPKGDTGEYGGLYLKGEVDTKSSLPSGGRTNDTYYVKDEGKYYALSESGLWLEVEASASAGNLESVLQEGNTSTRGASFGGGNVVLSADGAGLFKGAVTVGTNLTVQNGITALKRDASGANPILTLGSTTTDYGKITINGVASFKQLLIGAEGAWDKINLDSSGSASFAGGEIFMTSAGNQQWGGIPYQGQAGVFTTLSGTVYTCPSASGNAAFSAYEVGTTTPSAAIRGNGSASFKGDVAIGNSSTLFNLISDVVAALPEEVKEEFASNIASWNQASAYVDAPTTLPADTPADLLEAVVRVTTAGKINLNSNGSITAAGEIEANGGLEAYIPTNNLQSYSQRWFDDKYSTRGIVATMGMGGSLWAKQSVSVGSDASNPQVTISSDGSITAADYIKAGNSTTVYTKLYDGSMLISNTTAAGQGFGLYNTTEGEYTVALDMDGSITAAGNIQSGGDSLTGDNDGIIIAKNGTSYFSAASSLTTINSYTTGNSTPTFQVSADGSITAAGQVTVEGVATFGNDITAEGRALIGSQTLSGNGLYSRNNSASGDAASVVGRNFTAGGAVWVGANAASGATTSRINEDGTIIATGYSMASLAQL